MSQDLIFKQDGPALRITINRPDAGNAMSDDMALELTRLLEGAGANTQFVVPKRCRQGLLHRPRLHGPCPAPSITRATSTPW